MGERTSPWLLGIDLGTTNTAAVAFGPGPGPVSILRGRNQPIMPSVVSLKNPKLPLVGWLARDMMLTDPITTIYGWKRFIGRKERSEYVQRYRSRYPFRIHEDPNGRLGAVVSNAVAPFVNIAGLVLSQVRQQASALLREPVKDCVISVPAHFVNAQRDAILAAAERARLNVLQVVNEPTAAALAFGVDQQLDSRVMIFDLGGGTFDATILEVVDNVFDVKLTQGDGFLGGADFDRAVVTHLKAFCQRKHGVDITEEPVVAQRVLNAAEAAKCALSDQDKVRVHVPMIGHDRRGRTIDLDYMLTRTELESLTAPLIEKAIGIVEEMMRRSKMTPQHIQQIIAVGGQSKMPRVRARIEQVFGRAPLTHLNPYTCVAHGAALIGASSGSLTGAVLLDVLSVPIGLVLPGGRTQFVFEANNPLPDTKRIPLEPPKTGGDLVVGLWQGPSVTSSERQVLGVLRVPKYLFAAGAPFQLELKLSERLDIQATFMSAVQHAPLLLESSLQG